MTDQATRSRFSPPTFADLIAVEHRQVQAGAQGCGDTCLCHGGVTCVRLAHPHDPDADMGTTDTGQQRPRGNVVPHAGYGLDGQLVQWTCTDPATRALTADDHAAAKMQAQVDHSRAVLDALDPGVLREYLTAKG